MRGMYARSFFYAQTQVLGFFLLQFGTRWGNIYINVEESGTKWCEVVDEILFGGRSDLSDFSSTERQVFVLCSWENTITQWTQRAD